MYSLFALGSAALYGAADFIGGITSRKADTMAVVIVSQGAGMVLVALLLPLFGSPAPPRSDWWWGSAAGITGGVGVALLYRALAVGVMSVVAPITAVCAVAVPVVVAVGLMGERPALHAAIGIVVAGVAIGLVSQAAEMNAHASNRRAGVGLALASGVAIGLFFLSLARTSSDAGLWPLLFARISSVALFGVLLLGSRRSLSMPRPVFAMAVAGGIVDMLANLFYLLASRLGPLTLVVTLSSLYPASTVLLARFLLHERLTVQQWVGVALAIAAIIMIVTP